MAVVCFSVRVKNRLRVRDAKHVGQARSMSDKKSTSTVRGGTGHVVERDNIQIHTLLDMATRVCGTNACQIIVQRAAL